MAAITSWVERGELPVDDVLTAVALVVLPLTVRLAVTASTRFELVFVVVVVVVVVVFTTRGLYIEVYAFNGVVVVSVVTVRFGLTIVVVVVVGRANEVLRVATALVVAVRLTVVVVGRGAVRLVVVLL